MPRKGLKKQRDNFLKLLPKSNYHIGKTCTAVGISRQTYHDWLKRYEDFKKGMDNLEEEQLDNSEDVLKQLIKGFPKYKIINGVRSVVGWEEKPNVTALKFHLKAKGKSRGYADYLKLETQSLDPIKELTDSELIKKINRLNSDFGEEEASEE